MRRHGGRALGEREVNPSLIIFLSKSLYVCENARQTALWRQGAAYPYALTALRIASRKGLRCPPSPAKPGPWRWSAARHRGRWRPSCALGGASARFSPLAACCERPLRPSVRLDCSHQNSNEKPSCVLYHHRLARRRSAFAPLPAVSMRPAQSPASTSTPLFLLPFTAAGTSPLSSSFWRNAEGFTNCPT